MGAAVEQEIRVKIKALVDGLKSVQELQSAVTHLNAIGGKKFDLNTDKPAAGAFKLITVLRELSPQVDNVASRAERLSGTLGTEGLAGALAMPLGLLAAAGIVFTAAEVGLFKLAQNAAEAANRVGELSDQTGLSVEALSAIGTAAEQNHSSIEDFATGFGFLEKKISDAASGSKQAHDDLVRLGIEPKRAVNDLDYAVGQAFKTINDYKGTAHAAGLATDAFGKAGKSLIPTITSVGGSLDEAKRQAAELGTLLSKEAVDAARRFDDQMDQLGLRLKGVAYTTGNELVPSMTQLVTALNSLLGAAKPELVAFFQALAGQVRYFANQIAVAAAAVEAFNGSEGSFSDRFKGSLARYFAASTSDTGKPPATNPPGGGGGKKGGGKSLKERLEELAAQQTKSTGELNAAESTARIDSIKDGLDREKDLITRQLEARLISYREYYTKLAQIETDAIDQEILRQQAALQKIQDELAAELRKIDADRKLKPAEREAKRQIAETDAEAKSVPVLEKINELERDRAGVVSRVRADAIKTTEEYQRQLSAIRDELARFKGDDAEAAKHEIDERFRELRERAVAEGDAAAVAVIDALKRRLKQKSQFDDVEEQIRAVFQKIRDGEDALDAQVAVGQISPEAAERGKLEVARAQRQELEKLHGELKGIAQATKDPELLAAVDRLGVEIAQVGVEVDRLAQDINRDLKQALDDTLFAVIRRQQTLKEAVTSLVNHILDELARLASSAIIDKLFGEGGIFGGVFNSKGGQGGIGGILSGIFGPRTAGANPQAPQGSTSVFDTLPGIIKNFQGGAVGGLHEVNQSTKGVGDVTSQGFGQMTGLFGQAIPLLGAIANNSRVQTASAVFATVLTATKILAAGGGGAKAGGGLIEGPGTDTSDNLLSLLSPGEFVIRAASVRSLGPRVLNHLNSFGELPHFALGGLVSDLPTFDISGAGGLTINQYFNGRYEVKDGKLTQASRQQLERDSARLTKAGAQRSVASRK